MTRRVLITGGTGFLGVHLARTLLKHHWQVTLFDLVDLDSPDLHKKVRVVIGDITNTQALTKAMKQHNYVVHAAAALPIHADKQTIFSVNVDGTKNVLDAALKQKIKRCVFISSTAIYGIPKHLPENEDSPLDPIGYYGQSKIAAENICKEYMKKGLQVTILRPKTFLGTERLGIFSLWYEAIYNHRTVFLLGNGNNKYQLLAVSDMADAVYKALLSKQTNTVFTIGAKKFGTWRSDIGYVIKKAKSKSKIVGLPTKPSQVLLSLFEKLHLSPIGAWHYKTMPLDSYVTIKKAEQQLDWHPQKSNQALFWESYDWYRKNRNAILQRTGKTHRVNWNFKVLNLVSKL